MHDFGLMMATGMGIGLLIVFVAIPSMSRPLHPLPVAQSGIQAGPRKIVRLFAALSLRRPGWVVGAALVLLVMAVWGATRLSAQAKITQYFKKSTPVYQGLEYIDQNMGGTTPFKCRATIWLDARMIEATTIMP